MSFKFYLLASFLYSGGKTGDKWSSTLHFIDYYGDESACRRVATLDEDDLLDHFRHFGTREKLLNVEICKHRLTGATGLFGDWHEFLVIESTNFWWSFEKQNYALVVQRSKKISKVKDQLNGEDRPTPINGEGRSADVESKRESIYNIMEWIIERGELDRTYHITKSNCQFFASVLFEAIARRHGRRLDNSM